MVTGRPPGFHEAGGCPDAGGTGRLLFEENGLNRVASRSGANAA